MIVNIEEKSGFCFGVTRVVETAERILASGEKLYCLGQIVHNEKEVERLIRKGIVFIDHEELKNLRNVRVLIRAHGEPPSTYHIAGENNIDLIDGTCPIVKKLQSRIRKKFCSSEDGQRQIIIYGKDNHPEVIALKGQTGNRALVVRKPEDIDVNDLEPEVSLFSQTTMDIEGFMKVRDWIEENLIKKFGSSKGLNVNNTICGHISHRQPGLENFSAAHDVLIFVAGKKSSNGKVLFNVCRKVNENSHFISSADELKDEWFRNVERIGVCGATSTPRWLLEEVAGKIKNLK